MENWWPCEAWPKKRVHINIANIEKNVVKSVFGFNKDKVKSSDLWLACNLTLLNKLAKKKEYIMTIQQIEITGKRTLQQHADVTL